MYGVYFFSRTSYLMFTISAALSISAPLNEVPGSRLKFRLSIYVSVSSFPAVHDRSKLEVHQTQSDLHLHTPYASVITWYHSMARTCPSTTPLPHPYSYFNPNSCAFTVVRRSLFSPDMIQCLKRGNVEYVLCRANVTLSNSFRLTSRSADYEPKNIEGGPDEIDFLYLFQ